MRMALRQCRLWNMSGLKMVVSRLSLTIAIVSYRIDVLKMIMMVRRERLQLIAEWRCLFFGHDGKLA
jgi:hypothetical protein